MDLSKDVYAIYHNPLLHLRLAAFVSCDKRDFTIVGMRKIETDVELIIDLQSLANKAIAKYISYYKTGRNENYCKIGHLSIKENKLIVNIKENTIFTLTTLD